jgi:formate hydrogenlyase transcriptional activator
MKIDYNEFFRQSTIRLCGNLKIEEALWSFFKYVSSFIPANALYLEVYISEMNAMKIFAKATAKEGIKSDILLPVGKEGNTAMEEREKEFVKDDQPAIQIINDSSKDPIGANLLKMLDEPDSSILGMPYMIENKPMAAVVFLAEGKDRYNSEHAKLLSLLRQPFLIALSNALEHEEVVKLKDLLVDDNRYLHGELNRISGEEIIGANFGLAGVMKMARQVALQNSPVLLLGETGVGKDVIASAIHKLSERRSSPFISVNCGAIPDTLIDSELFGYEKGAFTGALSQKRGRFERADKGTIFLDEIGELPLLAQVRLLKVIQNHEIERVGGTKTIKLDIRIIAATNRNLQEMVESNEFREDLWFRLSVFPIYIPPLRDRKSDIPAFLEHSIKVKSKELKLRTVPILAEDAIENLMEYKWPGNIRELQNVVERELIINPEGPLNFNYLTSTLHKKGRTSKSHKKETDNLDEMVVVHILEVLTKTNGKIHGKDGAAALLGINPNTLRNRMNKLGIEYGRSVKK